MTDANSNANTGESDSTTTEGAMRLAPPDKTPDSKHPWKDDLLGRAKYGGALHAAVKGFADKGASILLDGGDGTGKTFILERWAHALRNEDVPVRHYNAWEHDGDEDPLVSLVECLTDKDGKRPYDIGAVAEDLCRQTTKLLVGVDVQSALAKGAGKGEPDFFKAIKKRHQASKILRDGLSKWAKDGVRGYAVVIIDELDRCRQSFALRVMERVKHVLKTPSVAFVFGASRDALTNAFLHEYGSDADAEGYFLRMFDCPLALPPGVFFDEGEKKAEVRYVEALADGHKLASGVRALPTSQIAGVRDGWGHQLSPILSLLASGGEFTPREFEKLMQGLTVSVAMEASSEGSCTSLLRPWLLLPMVVAALKRPDVYRQMIAAPNQGASVVDCLAELLGEKSPAPQMTPQIRQWLDNLAEKSPAPNPSTRQEQVGQVLNMVEMSIYLACRNSPLITELTPIGVLEAVRDGRETTDLELGLLAARSRSINKERATSLLENTGVLDSPIHRRLDFSSVRHWAERINMIRSRD